MSLLDSFMANDNMTNFTAVLDLPIDMVYVDFDVMTHHEIATKVNIYTMIIESVVGVILLLTIIDKNLREKSPLWYLYHLNALTLLSTCLLYIDNLDVLQIRAACFVYIYGSYHINFYIGLNVILFNVEVFCAEVLRFPRWQKSYFYRFIIVTLACWIYACLLVSYLIINNNAARFEEGFCYRTHDPHLLQASIIFSDLIPLIACIIFTTVFILTYVLKQLRRTGLSKSNDLRDITSDAEYNQWSICIYFLNALLIAREAISVVLHFGLHATDNFTVLIYLYLIFCQVLHLMPFSMFFLSDVRLALRRFAVIVLRRITDRGTNHTDDSEIFRVSFAKTPAEN